MTLHAFGDSFVFGDQDEAGLSLSNCPPEYPEYLKNEISFVSHIARHLNLPLNNHARSGSGCFPQLDKLTMALTNDEIVPGDLVLFGITAMSRERASCIYHSKAISNDWGESIVDRELLLNGELHQLLELDYFYILCILDKLRDKFGVKILAFNLFDTPLDHLTKKKCDLFIFADFVGGCTGRGNTLIDILNDTWGKPTTHCMHTLLQPPAGYENLYTPNRHPSIEGHQKIAKWFIDHVDLAL
jgi:hypothetical protein